MSKPQSLPSLRLAPALVERLYAKANGGRWALAEPEFAAALERSAVKSLASAEALADQSRVERYLSSLHLEDLALACACAAGHEGAWDHFVREYRPVLYRAADALAPGGRLREVADAIYGELFGLQERDGERRSLFRYFHGRSSLATWLRAVLAQRQVDRVRSERRLTPLEPLENEASLAPAIVASSVEPDPDRPRFLALVKLAILRAVAALTDRDRLRLACYYREDLTLAQTGRLLGEHEATVSRQLARSRKAIRKDMERYLEREHGFTPDELERCFEAAMSDAGTLDMAAMLGSPGGRKDTEPDRSI